MNDILENCHRTTQDTTILGDTARYTASEGVT